MKANERALQDAIKASLASDAEAVRKRRQRVELISKRLHALGLKRQETPPHGDCQFIAVCRVMGFPGDAHEQLRYEVVEFLKKHQAEFEDFQTDGWARYIAKMQRSGTWGDHITLLAMSRMFNCCFKIVEDDEAGTINNVQPFGEEVFTEFTLAHFGEIHYESTTSLADSGRVWGIGVMPS